MDEGKIINIINKEILYPEVLLNENNELISLNGYTNIKEYDHFIYELQTNMEKEVKKNIKKSRSRINALLYVKELRMHLYKLLRSFTTFEDNDLNEELNFFYEYLKSTQSKMPQEFINIKTHTVFINNNIIHDNIENGEEKRKFYNRLSVFVKKQYKLIIEIIDNIELYVDFVENITVEDFKHKDEFFEYSFNTLKLSDSLKLTNKDVNIKIKNLDIRQTALLFHYLEESGLFLKYDNGTKAYFAHYLTGHSMSNLRTDSGFGIIESIKKDREKPKDYNDLKFYNLNTLKKQVSSVIKLIDDDIKRLENKA